MKKLEGRVVIITGASAGIGEATARRLAREGARVVLAARRKDKLDALKREIVAEGGDATAVVADITSPGDRQRLVSEAVAAHGRIDALINNAGYGHRGPIELVPIESIRQNFETNLFSLIALTQLVIPIMRGQGEGRIVNVSSVAGKIARPLSSVYDSTKHALEAVSDGLRGELAMFGIKVVIIEPGFITTEFSEVSNRVSRPVVEEAGFYDESLKDFGRGSERMRKMAGRPEDIAALIERALAAKNPRPRYAGPGPARLPLGFNEC